MDTSSLRGLWKQLPYDKIGSRDTLYLAIVGFFVGLCAGSVVSVFRIAAGWAYAFSVRWTGPEHRSFWVILAWLAASGVAAYITGRLIKDPAIRLGGKGWIQDALKEGQANVWRRILIPKFIGSFLVKGFGNSVGMEGPSIQMGCATALGLKNFNNQQKIERGFFIVGGSAAGLAAAFSSPFAGICWSYEIMKHKLTSDLFLFMLAGAFGVYTACTAIFGLGTMLPFASTPMPHLAKFWVILLLGVFSGACGIAYNYLLRASLDIYSSQKLVPVRYRPFLAFGGAAVFMLFFPAVTGEGFTIFGPIDAGHTTMLFLCLFLIVKLLLTAYCYGSGIPAGEMVPVLCIGGVSGAIFSDWMQAIGALGPDYFFSCIVMGMAGAFAAAERAPVTGLVLVAETTGAYGVGLGMLVTAATGSWLARIAGVK